MKELFLLGFLKEYVSELKVREPEIEIRYWIDEEVVEEEDILDVVINSNKELFVEVLDNLVENAKSHAFTKFSGKKSIEISVLLTGIQDFKEIQIDVSNTGHRVRESFDMNYFTQLGSKAGENAGSGIGLWHVDKIMKKHGGRFEFTDELGPEGVGIPDLVSTFELYFPVKDIFKNNG